MNYIIFAISIVLIIGIPLCFIIKTGRKMKRFLCEMVNDEYPDEKFNLEWFCYNPPMPEKSGRAFGVPALAAFEILVCKLQIPANQIEQMLGRCMVFGTNGNDYIKDVSGREYSVKVEWERYKKLYGDKTKKGLNGMVGMDCRRKY